MKYSAFPGRWAPLHKGHKHIVLKKYAETGEPPLFWIRDTVETIHVKGTVIELTPEQRKRIIDNWLKEEEIPGVAMIVPDFARICFSRNVGYEIEEIKVPPEVAEISATELRRLLGEEDYWNAIKLVEDVEYSEEEEDLIEERLRKLGYLE